MGSGQSVRVQSADIQQSKRSQSTVKRKSSSDVETHVEEITDVKDELVTPEKVKKTTSSKGAQENIAELEKKIKTIYEQMTELECQNLDLQDHVQSLEQQIEFNEKADIEKNECSDYTETLHIKQQNIEKLQTEVEKLNTEMSKLRIKFKKKLRMMKAKFAESKNDGSLEVFEMREIMNKLKEENEVLKKKQISNSKEEQVKDNVHEEGAESGKMKIILDLSSRVSEQDAKITELENKLTEKVKHIERLEKQQKQNKNSVTTKNTENEVTSTKTKQLRNKDVASKSYGSLSEQSGVDWYTNKTFEQLATAARAVDNPNTATTSSVDNDEDDLKDIAEEIKKLQLSKKKGKAQRTVSKPQMDNVRSHNAELEHDSRHSSGVSRDSGYSLHSENAVRGGAFSSKHRNGSANSRVSAFSYDSAVSQDSDDTYTNKERVSEGGGDINMSDYSEFGAALLGHDLESKSGYSESQRSTPIDPSNIRQISALGAKAKRKKGKGLVKNLEKGSNRRGEMDTLEDKPPLFMIASKRNELNEADMLLDSIDDDLLKFSKSSVHQSISAASS